MLQDNFNSVSKIPTALNATLGMDQQSTLAPMSYYTVTTPGQSWQAQHGNGGDGYSNLDEYTFGLNPKSGSSCNPITVPLDMTTGTFRYTRRHSSLTPLNYRVWYSTDLGTWTKDTGAIEGAPVPAGELETVLVTLSSSLLAEPALFIQIRAE